MHVDELFNLIKTGEGYTLEFKEGFNTSIDKEICAFANASGGRILLGVNDSNSIVGFSSSNEFSSKIQSIARNMEPSLQISFEQIGDVVVVFIPEGDDKPYSVGGRFYLRQGASSQRLSRDELIYFFQKCNKISFEKQVSDFNLEDDFNTDKFEVFRRKAKIASDLSIEHVLKNLNLLTEGKPNNACALLFSRRVTNFFLSADISCVLYKGTSKVVMLDKKVFNADFISNFENALLFILRNIRTQAQIVGVQRIEIPEIPENALRESILNAMIHKDYFVEGRVLINIFDDKVEIFNPGKLLFDEKELGEISVTRNPVLADCMLRAGFVERIGSGIKRIKGLVPDTLFETGSEWFKIIFKRKIIFQTPMESSEKTSEKTSEKIKQLMLKNNQVTINELAKKLDLSTRAVENNISKLKKAGMIKRIGADKGGYWLVFES